jgi:hypothetical protein
MNSVVQVIEQPIVVVDRFQFDLSNLAISKASTSRSMQSSSYDTNSRPEEDDSSRRCSAESSFASYPKVNEIPACLDVDDIFDKLKALNMLKKGKLANPRLAGWNRFKQPEEKKLASPTRRPRNTIDVEPNPFSVTVDKMIRQDDPKGQEASYGRHDDYRIHDDYSRQEDHRSRMRYRAEDEQNSKASSYDDYHRPNDRQTSRDDGYRRYDDHQRGGREEHQRRSAVEPPRHEVSDYDEDEQSPSEDEEDRILVEVMPGTFVPLRGSAETWAAVQSGHITRTTCFSCTTRLVCIDDADMVMCPACQLISPVDGGLGGGGLGLGMKADDAFHELERLRQSRRTALHR